jgi:hypothetical protein
VIGALGEVGAKQLVGAVDEVQPHAPIVAGDNA